MMDAGRPIASEAGCRPIAWPWHVRWLAVAYVLSRVAGPFGFFVLAGVMALVIRRHGLCGEAAFAALATGAWPLGCAAFRWWFRSWGRRRWPDD